MRKGKTVVLLVLAVLLIAGSSIQGRRLLESREDSERIELHDAPPMVVFSSVVLGGFKGILADILWLRASLLQDEGRYLELVQLSDWITKLEPHIAEIWVFHAWNMAYNVSVMMPKPEDRWRWVRNGIALLRDEGTVYNPADPKLYFELGWFFQHKMGGSTDTMHLYYKKEWAKEMSVFVDAKGHIDYDSISDELKKKLKDEYRLDIAHMKEIDERYGPLDWRLPEANAIYWAGEGTRAGRRTYLACDRVVYQSMMQVFRRGKLQFAPESDTYEVSFNPDALPGAMQAFEDTMAKYPGQQTVKDSYALFLREAVRRLNAAGLTQEAMRLFEKVAKDFPGDDTTGGYEAFLAHEDEHSHHN